jgi:hypothetical protein
MPEPKFEVRQLVYKWTGNYGGPGIVRGIANDEGQPLRYLVGHRIEGGYGEFFHVYAEGNLRETGELFDLPTISKQDGLKSRTGLATPDADVVVIDPLSAVIADDLTPEQVANLKAAWSQSTKERMLLPGVAPNVDMASLIADLTPEQLTALNYAVEQVLARRAPIKAELLNALVEAHHQVDILLAMVVTLDKSFMPSQSPMWPEIVKRAELLRKHGATDA